MHRVVCQLPCGDTLPQPAQFEIQILKNTTAAWAAVVSDGSTHWLLDIKEAAQLFRTAGVAQFAQRLGFYLADAFAGHIELLADFL